MATDCENVVNVCENADVNAVDTTDEEHTAKKSKEKEKSCWREIERMKSKIRLLKALKEIDPEFDPYSSREYMDF